MFFEKYFKKHCRILFKYRIKFALLLSIFHGMDKSK
jgi:hypothetical protein